MLYNIGYMVMTPSSTEYYFVAIFLCGWFILWNDVRFIDRFGSRAADE